MTKKAKIILGIVITLILAAGSGAYYAWNYSYRARSIVDTITSVVDVKPEEPAKEEEVDRPLYYFYDDQSYRAENTEDAVKRSKSAIFQVNFDGLDQFAMKLPLYWWAHYQYVGKVSSDAFVFARPDATYIINPAKKTSELLIKKEVNSILASHDGKKIAYVIKDPQSGIDWWSDPGQLWTYDLETKKHTKLAQSKELLYSGMHIQAWSMDNKKIYTNSTGGDGGASWNRMEIYDLETPEKGLQEIKINKTFVLGESNSWHINPGGEYLIGKKCDAPGPTEDFGNPQGELYSCPGGEQLLLYNLTDKSIKTIYTVQSGQVSDKDKAGKVYFESWFGEDTVIFTEEDRHDLISLNIVTGEKRVIVNAAQDFAPILSDPSMIAYYVLVSDRYAVAYLDSHKDGSDEEDYFIAYDLKTKKVKKNVVDRPLDPNDPGHLFRNTERFLFAY